MSEAVARAARGELQGRYFTDHAAGALPNGTRVEKVNTKRGDGHQDGALATVIGSLGPTTIDGVSHFGYFVVWDDHPTAAVLITGQRIRPITSS